MYLGCLTGRAVMYGKFFVFFGAVCPADGTQTKHGKTVTLGHKKWAPRGLYPDNMSRLYHKRRGTAIRIPPRLRAMGAGLLGGPLPPSRRESVGRAAWAGLAQVPPNLRPPSIRRPGRAAAPSAPPDAIFQPLPAL